MASRKARNPFADSTSPSPPPKPPANKHPPPASPQQPQPDNGVMFGFKRFLGNLMGSSSTPAPSAPRTGSQNNPFVISPSPEPVPHPQPGQSPVAKSPSPPHDPGAQPVKLSESPELVPQVVSRPPSPAGRGEPTVALDSSPAPAPALVRVRVPSPQLAPPSQPLRPSAQVAALAQAPLSGPQRGRNPFAYSPSPPPAINGQHRDAAQSPVIQDADSRHSGESRASSVVTDPELFGFDGDDWVFSPPPAVRRRAAVAEDNYQSPLFIPERREATIVLDDGEDDNVVKEENTSNIDVNSSSVGGPASHKHSSLSGDGDLKPSSGKAPCITEKKAQHGDKHQHLTNGSGSAKSRSDTKSQPPKEESPVLVFKRRQYITIIGIDSDEEVDTPKEGKSSSTTDLISVPAKSAIDKHSPLANNESSKELPGAGGDLTTNGDELMPRRSSESDAPKETKSPKTDSALEPVDSAIDKYLPPPPANESLEELAWDLPENEDELMMLPPSIEEDAPIADAADTFLPSVCHQRAEPTGLDDDVSPLRLDFVADKAEVGSIAGKSRSRSVETDPSVFGSPTGEDELILSPEADGELPAEQSVNEEQANDEPSADDPELDQADAMSISSVSSTQTLAQIGVEWMTGEFDHFNPYPQWSCEPEAHEVVELLQQVVSPVEEYNVTFLHKSAYNAFFAVDWADESYVVKVTIPVCPVRKTESEVATMRWAKVMTPLPLPDVVQNLYSTSANNPIGCEWILMRKVHGRPLFDCWHELDMPRKRRIVEQLAEYTVCVFDRGLDGISSLYPAGPDDPDRRPEMLGMASTMPFFWNGRYHKKPRCGPYETYREWAFDRLDLAHADAEKVLPKLENRHIRLIPWRIQAVINKLKKLHDVLFPSSRTPVPDSEEEEMKKEEPPKGGTKYEPIDILSDSEDGDDVTATNSVAGNNDNNSENAVQEVLISEEPTMMWHTNLSTDNIFIDNTGVITGVLDWECISAIPRSVACQLPAFLLEGHDRYKEPCVEHYWTFSDTLSHHSSDDEEDNENEREEDEEERRGRSRRRKRRRVGPTPEFWQARREWELTQLRHHFERIMAERSIGWHMCYKHYGLKRDFETAVQYCDDPLLLKIVEKWVDDVEAALLKKKEKNAGSSEPKVRGLEMWSLERQIARGHRAPAGHNERREMAVHRLA